NNLLYSAGQDIVNGLTAGIRSKIGEAVDAAQSAASSVKNSVKGFLGINSPSTVMAELGVNTIEGFVVGLRKAMPLLRSDLQGVAAAVPGTVNARLSGVTTPPAGSMVAPAVYVTIGNEAVDQYVTVRAQQVVDQNARTNAQGRRL
ncbi:MAG: phage tail protein, partial [Pseudonocardia sp.]